MRNLVYMGVNNWYEILRMQSLLHNSDLIIDPLYTCSQL